MSGSLGTEDLSTSVGLVGGGRKSPEPSNTGPEQGDKGEALSHWWPWVIWPPRGPPPSPFIPSGPQRSAFSSFSRSAGSGLWELTRKLIKWRQKQVSAKLLPVESWVEQGWQCGWGQHPTLIAFSFLELFLSFLSFWFGTPRGLWEPVTKTNPSKSYGLRGKNTQGCDIMGWTVALLCQSPGNTVWRCLEASTQWCAGTSSYELVRIDCTLPFPTSKSWCHVGRLNWPWWEYLHHRNRQVANQAFSAPKLVVKHLPACHCLHYRDCHSKYDSQISYIWIS